MGEVCFRERLLGSGGNSLTAQPLAQEPLSPLYEAMDSLGRLRPPAAVSRGRLDQSRMKLFRCVNGWVEGPDYLVLYIGRSAPMPLVNFLHLKAFRRTWNDPRTVSHHGSSNYRESHRVLILILTR